MTRQPRVSNLHVHDVTAEHVEVGGEPGHTWMRLGPVTIHADDTETLVQIGHEIIRQAAAVSVDHRIDDRTET